MKNLKKKIDISSYLEVVALNSKIKLGSFEIDFITLTHSILEPNGLSIKTLLVQCFILVIGKLTQIHL